MLDQEKYEDIFNAFAKNDISISQFICNILQHHHLFGLPHSTLIDDLFANSKKILVSFMSHPQTFYSSRDTVHHYACEIYSREIRTLTSTGSGLQFNAKHARASQVHDFNSDLLMANLSKSAPYLWKLILKLLIVDGISEGALSDANKLKIMHIVSTSTSRLLYLSGLCPDLVERNVFYCSYSPSK